MEISVIGAGVGGLTSALLLAEKGYHVTIFEKDQRLGGRLTYETNGEFTIDQGPTIVLLPELLLEILEEAGISRDKLNLIPCDPLYDLFFAGGTKLTKWQDPDKQQKAIEQLFPEEVPRFKRYMEDMNEIYHFGYHAFLSKSFDRMRDFLTFQNMKFVMKSQSYRSLSSFLSRYFTNDYLKQAYMLQSLYIGGSPYRVPALYGLISYSEHAFGIWYLKGGYHSLIPLLEEACIRKGITIYKSTEVTEIMVQQNRVVGLKAAGKQHRFDQVIFNGEYPFLERLLKDERVKSKKQDYQPSSGCLLAYLGVNKRFSKREAHQFFLPEQFEQHMNEVFEQKTLSAHPSSYLFNPVALDHEAAPAGKSVFYVLIPVPANPSIDWQKEKDRIVDNVLETIEETAFPGLRQHVEWLKIRTPDEASEAGLFLGGSFGIAPHLNQSGGFRPQIVHPTIKGLYTVGASVHPGGGIPIVMQGARLLVQHIEKEKEMVI
ncbi:phytoene desaturase family protein [Gracilibacillus massiliensis]|uniref:phytoene desaturase family protein n=1 Tax=Gracilibacillus massiliensis TaxID=1564956 RepID=UPI00071E62FC|nr:phytoene desaturase family protein [Gracilibacillus massiliensis]